MTNRAFQDAIPHNGCFGCGPSNPQGLRIKSYWSDVEAGQAVCTFQPEPHHSAGPEGILNGGIIATIMDCHAMCTAMADAYRREGREIGSAPLIWCATASMNISYLRPARTDGPVRLEARVTAAGERRSTVSCSLFSNGSECARAELVAVRVGSDWAKE